MKPLFMTALSLVIQGVVELPTRAAQTAMIIIPDTTDTW
jgi:hypothetical protein